MAPTRYAQGNRPTQGPAGDGHALAARDSDSAVQGHGSSSYDDGYYHPSSYHAGEKGQMAAEDGSYPSKKKDSTTRKDSSLATADQASRESQQGQGYESGSQNGSQYSGSQYGSSLGNGSQKAGSQYSGSQYAGSQNTNSQNTGSYNAGSQSGSHSGSPSNSYNSGAYQQSSNTQNTGQQHSQQGTPNSGYSHGQGVAAQQQANSDAANTNAQQQSSWSQQNAQDAHSQPKQSSQQSQETPSNANHEQSSYKNNDHQAAGPSHEQDNKDANLSDAHASEEHHADTAENERHNLVNNHVAPAATMQTAQQPTHTLPTLTTGTLDPTWSLTTSAATTDSTHTTLPTTSSTSSATSSPTPEAAKDSDDGSYHKATGALAGLLGVALVAGFVIFWLARRKRQQKSETNRSKMVRDAFRQSYANTKQRTSQFYTNFLGTAVGTGASALGAVRRSLAMAKSNHHSHEKPEKAPMPQEGHVHHPCDDGIHVRGHDLDYSSGHDSDRNDSIAAEKAAINESTPTLVVSPSESMARDQTPTVRRVISGRPQMESSESVEPKSGLSHNAQESEPEPNDKAPEQSPSTPHPAPDNAAANYGAQENGPPPRNGNGQNLLAITSMVPSSTSVYRVEIAFQPKKVGQLDLREGQHIIIRQSFDDGWVLCTPADGSQEGLAPRACLSSWPIKNASSASSSNHNLSDGTRTPESPTAPGTPRFYSHFYSARSVTQ
ncbi:hypothetical protein SI65_00246 [Aspergillus cristatus]|uniref:SH3 domain-containing protein n=1 Tax=Aspergillus cristatus TaxID=573508 RepID=A0A1E3BP38_ASPCR|nr:hypothetical protein SI65_00246 [Aspergillus cristatus]